MPASYTIDTDRKLVVSRIWGAATEDEIFDHSQRLRNDPQFRPDFRQLVDMSELTEIRVGPGVIRDASRDQFFSPGARRAVVANSDAAARPLVRVPLIKLGYRLGHAALSCRRLVEE
jgi:hypothetical protein